MNKIQFLRDKTKAGLYYTIVKLDGVLDDLAHFFTDEIGGEKDSAWIDFLDDLTQQKMSGNELLLEKKGSDVYISNVYCDEPADARLKIPRLELLELIQTWEHLMEEGPEEISLIYESGKFEFIEGSGRTEECT